MKTFEQLYKKTLLENRKRVKELIVKNEHESVKYYFMINYFVEILINNNVKELNNTYAILECKQIYRHNLMYKINFERKSFKEVCRDIFYSFDINK